MKNPQDNTAGSPPDARTRTDYWVSDTRSIRIDRIGSVAVTEFSSGAHNYLDIDLLSALARCMESLDSDPSVRSMVMLSSGKTFCAGANFQADGKYSAEGLTDFYAQAQRLFALAKPVVAAIQGPAVGAGLGLALSADFRVSCPEARFSANFSRLGIHPGFGLTLTLPRLIGLQRAALMFYTGRRIDGAEAQRIGLVDSLVSCEDVSRAAIALAQEIATSAPLAVEATKATLHQRMAEDIRAACAREVDRQTENFRSADFLEGVSAMAARRPPVFLRR